MASTLEVGDYHQGAPGLAHGGIIATAMDEAMGALNRLLLVPVVTVHLEVDYVRPVPVGSTAVSTEERPTVVNVGGPARLSRADFARSVAAAVGAPASAVVESRASEAVRAVASPADIAMDISLLRGGLGFEPRSVEAVIAEEL